MFERYSFKSESSPSFVDHVKNQDLKFLSTLLVLIVLSQQRHKRPTL